MKALLATVVLLALGACSTGGADAPGRRAARSPQALPAAPPPPPMADDRGACAADVQQCADGSTVSRNPDKDCTFNACPGENTK